jgi:protein gp37
MSVLWNPWHGCEKYSEGCEHCYVYRIDKVSERDSRQVKLNSTFSYPVQKGRGGYKIKSGETVYTCFSSDFFLDRADAWRGEAWRMIAERRDLKFIMFTKRAERIAECLPEDWGDGSAYEHVTIGCTCENQRRADERMPIFLSLPIKHRVVICEPLLGEIDMTPYLDERIQSVSVGGESGPDARICDYDWVLGIRDACTRAGVPFNFHQTGAKFRKDGKIYTIPRKQQQEQARRAGIDVE